MDNGNQVRVIGEGQPGINGGPNGNFYLELEVQPHRFFRRSGTDLLLDLDINIAQAALGDEISIPTLEGSEKLRIPPGTQPGKVFKLKDKGIPLVNRQGSRGNQLVTVNVQIPTQLNAEQKQLLESLRPWLRDKIQERSFLDKLKDARWLMQKV